MKVPRTVVIGTGSALLVVALTCRAAPDPVDLFGAVDRGQKASDQLADVQGWEGLGADATLAVPGEASFTYPDGEKGWYRVGEATAHDGSGYWRDRYGVRFDLHLPSDVPLTAEAIMKTAARRVYGGSEMVVNTLVSPFGLVGEGLAHGDGSN